MFAQYRKYFHLHELKSHCTYLVNIKLPLTLLIIWILMIIPILLLLLLPFLLLPPLFSFSLSSLLFFFQHYYLIITILYNWVCYYVMNADCCSHSSSVSVIPGCVWARCEQCEWVIMIICRRAEIQGCRCFESPSHEWISCLSYLTFMS